MISKEDMNKMSFEYTKIIKKLREKNEMFSKCLEEIREYVKTMSDSRDIDQTYDIWYSCKEYLLDKINKCLGDKNENSK